jgi:hypothetical protein
MIDDPLVNLQVLRRSLVNRAGWDGQHLKDVDYHFEARNKLRVTYLRSTWDRIKGSYDRDILTVVAATNGHLDIAALQHLHFSLSVSVCT